VVPPNADIPGNPWIITTLWDAQWDIARANTLKDLDKARAAIEWVKLHAMSSGIIAEQLHPQTGTCVSVAPLTWSHATYVETILQFMEKEKELEK
jgi:GH15 family glucan-1,4-alpha-glucosidase